jgi:LEA14-like dessication related protein
MRQTVTLASTVVICATLAAACFRPKPVEITPQSLRLSSIGPEGVGLAVVLDVHNPNRFPVSASAINAVLELQDGSELGQGSATPAFTIPAEGNAAVPAQLAMRWTNLALLAPYALNAQPLPYRLRGSARIGGQNLNLELPFTISGQLTSQQVLQAGIRGATSLFPTH